MLLPLLPHQKAALDALVAHHGRLLLHADCGTGKTAVALAAAERVAGHGRPILYVCPKIVMSQIESEAHRFTDLPTILVTGPKDIRDIRYLELKKYYDQKEAVLVIINYELLNVDFARLLPVPWILIVADECQKVSSPVAATTKHLKRLHADFRLPMSGTPAANALHNFFSMIDWLNPGVLGKNFYNFRALHCRTNPYIPQQITGYYDELKLRKIIDVHVHRVRREDVLRDLPPLTERVVSVDLDETERKTYTTLGKDLILEVDGRNMELTVPNILSCLTRLRQLVDCCRTLGIRKDTSKQKSAWEHIDFWLENPENSIIVFAEHTTALHDLRRRYEDHSEIIEGATSDARRREIVKKVMAGTCRLLFASAAAGEGLNLQAVNKILHYSMSWTAARMEQRNGRAWRHGQTRPVETVTLLVRGTIDERMFALVQKKKKLTKEDLVPLLREI